MGRFQVRITILFKLKSCLVTQGHYWETYINFQGPNMPGILEKTTNLGPWASEELTTGPLSHPEAKPHQRFVPAKAIPLVEAPRQWHFQLVKLYNIHVKIVVEVECKVGHAKCICKGTPFLSPGRSQALLDPRNISWFSRVHSFQILN